MAIGDDDQTIYQWRGSDVRNILTFRDRYPKVAEVRLEENFRSSEGIVAVARDFVRPLGRRLEKEMKATAAQAYEPGDIVALRAGDLVPADGAVLDRAPREIVLTFNEKISPQYAQLILSRDGTALSIAEPVVTGEVIRVPLAETATGDYRLAFRVVSADGHPISGESHYTVRGAVATPSTTTTAATTTAATTPTPPGTVTSPPSAAAAGTRQPTESQANHLPGILIGGGLVAVAVALLWWDRRRRQASPGG